MSSDTRCAQICALSGPDEVLVSDPIRTALEAAGSGDDVAARLRLVDRGEHALKGIAVPQHVYAVVGADERTAALA